MIMLLRVLYYIFYKFFYIFFYYYFLFVIFYILFFKNCLGVKVVFLCASPGGLKEPQQIVDQAVNVCTN